MTTEELKAAAKQADDKVDSFLVKLIASKWTALIVFGAIVTLIWVA